MAIVKNGDLVRLEYTGKVAASGEVFETTEESVARAAGIFRPSDIYGPKLVLFGTGTVMQGVEEAILTSQEGKSADFAVPPEKGFGERVPGLVRMISEKEFAKQGIRPALGMVLTFDGVLGRVKSVTSGRVTIDFNHPLAGEQLAYSLKVLEVISGDEKKIAAILSSLSLTADVSKKGESFAVSFKNAPAEKVEIAKRAISAAVPGTVFA